MPLKRRRHRTQPRRSDGFSQEYIEQKSINRVRDLSILVNIEAKLPTSCLYRFSQLVVYLSRSFSFFFCKFN